MKTESGACEVWKFGCLRNRNTKDQKYKNKNKWLISKTQSWTFRPTVFVHTSTQTLMRSGKSSHKNNLSCCGHELIPVCLSSDEPSKSFSSQPSVQSHPGHYCTDKTCTHQGHDAAKWKYRPPSSSFCLLLLPPFSSSFFPFPLTDTFRPSHVRCWHTDNSSLILPHRLHSLSQHDTEIKKWCY